MSASELTIGSHGIRAVLNIRRDADNGPFSVRVKNPDGTLIDPTGHAFTGWIKKKADDASALVTMSGTLVGTQEVTFTFTVSKTSSLLLAASPTSATANESVYVWTMDWNDGVRTRPLFYGPVYVLRKV